MMTESDETNKKHHQKGDKVHITKDMHHIKAGTRTTVASVHHGMYYGVVGPSNNIVFVPQQHVDPPPSDSPPDPPSGNQSVEWLDEVMELFK